MQYHYNFRHFRSDCIAGIVVFLVAIPLCLGIALASNAPLFSGVLAGIIGGLVVGGISQSPVSVSGPAAGMIAIVLTAIAQLGSFENFLFALVVAGALQMLISVLRAGFVADYIPSNVIQGLLCAIGILIIIKQLPLAFTHPEQHQTLITTLKHSAQTFDPHMLLNFKNHINWGSTTITLASITLLAYNDHARIHWFKKIPAPIVVILFGIIINALYTAFYPALIQTSAQLVNIPVNNHFKELFAQFTFPNWHNWRNPTTYLYGFIIATVASLETLLNLEAAEKLDRNKRYSSKNRELFAQGVGNILAGLLGGLPITSVIVRASVNIQAGAKTKFATIIHGALFLVAILFAAEWLNKIPLASLAAILIYVGYKLTRISIYKQMYRQGFAHYFPFLLTIIAIVSTNILEGVLIGLFSSMFFILKENSKMRLNIINEKHPSGMIQRIILPQQLSFLKKASLVSELNSIIPKSRLIIDARATEYMDNDILQLIKDFSKDTAPNKNIELNLIGFKEHYEIHNRIDFIGVTTYDVQSELTPTAVTHILREGNQRFVQDQRIHRSFPSEVKATAHNQYPIAVVLSCIDSRVPVETIFDMGVGDLFVVRVAGNVVNQDVLGSIEFACHIANAKLILVLGHTGCGAIAAACDYQDNGYIAELLKKILPAVNAEQSKNHEQHITDTTDDPFFRITKRNITNSLETIYQSSTIIKNLVDQKTVGLVSAMYDIHSGIVHFYEDKTLSETVKIDALSMSATSTYLPTLPGQNVSSP